MNKNIIVHNIIKTKNVHSDGRHNIRLLRQFKDCTITRFTHANGSHRGRVFTAVRLSAFPHDISKTDAAKITKLHIQKCSTMSSGNPFILGQKVKGRGHES